MTTHSQEIDNAKVYVSIVFIQSGIHINQDGVRYEGSLVL